MTGIPLAARLANHRQSSLDRGGWSMVAEVQGETTCGEIDYTSFVPLEDVHVGWCTDDQWFKPNPKNGAVGQEIYGAGGPIWYAVWQKEGEV